MVLAQTGATAPDGPDCGLICDRMTAILDGADGTSVALDTPLRGSDVWSAATGLPLGSTSSVAPSLIGSVIENAVSRLAGDAPLASAFDVARANGLATRTLTGIDVTMARQIPAGTDAVVTLWLEGTAQGQEGRDGILVSARFEIADADNSLLAHGAVRWFLSATEKASAAKGGWPKPPVNHDNQFWWDAADEGRLLIQRCADCNTLRHPPGPMCPHCNSLNWDTVEASGRGTVYSYTIHHQSFADMPAPFVVVLVDMEEGVRMVANLVGTSAVEIGMPVKASFRKPRPGERHMLQFTLADAALGGSASSNEAMPEVQVTITPTMVAAGAVANGALAPLHLDTAHARKLGWRDVVLDNASATALAEHYLAGQNIGAAIKGYSADFRRPASAGVRVALTGELVENGGSRKARVTGESTEGTHFVIDFVV